MRVLGRKHKWRSESAPKPSGRRPMRTELSDACFAMLEACREEGATDGLRAKWDAAWGQWAPCALGLEMRLAGLLLHTGWTVETAFGDHRRAAAYMEMYFEHPQAGHDDAVTIAANRCRLGRSLMLSGDTARGVGVLRLVYVEGTRATSRTRVLGVRDTLLAVLDAMPGDTTCDAALAKLASEVAARLRRKKAAGAMLRAGVTIGEVAEGLRLTGSSE